jgi:outer membrane protein
MPTLPPSARAAALALALAAVSLAAPARAARVLTLEEALRVAREQQPSLRQAEAAAAAARARVRGARAPLLPQVTGTAGYQRTTGNFAPRPGLTLGGGAAAPDPSFETFDYFQFGLTVSQHVYDFGQTLGRYDAAKASAAARGHEVRAAAADVSLGVTAAFFDARARRALVRVAEESLANQDRHLEQIEAFVAAGTRPIIDLAQARADRANAVVRLVGAQTAYEAARARLGRAMGVVEPGEPYEVADDALPPVEGEERATAELLRAALEARPEAAALAEDIRAAEERARSILGRWGPTIGVSTGLTEVGMALDDLTWNWNVGVTLTWPLFEGLAMDAAEEEALADLDGLRARAEGLRQQIRLQLEEARLGVLAAGAMVTAAGEALAAARERLRLAEGRYESGVGNVIELGDAQLALTDAEAQVVQAHYDLSTARARLLWALGRM